MKRIFTILTLMAAAPMAILAAGNGDKVSASNVFDGKLLKTIAAKTEHATVDFTYNDKLQLMSVRSQGPGYIESWDFDYSGGTVVGTDYDVMLVVTEEDEVSTLYITLGENLFASHVYQVDVEDNGARDTSTWDFEYNSDGQLAKVTHVDGYTETSVITYINGDIVNVNTTSGYDTDFVTLKYDGSVPNTAGMMFYDAVYDIDIDDLEMAYYAGLLGKAAKNLPTACVQDDETAKFTWTLNDESYPSKLVIQADGERMTFDFEWAYDAGIDGIEADGAATVQGYYTISGQALDGPAKGLNIVRKSDGTAEKVLIK